MRVLVVEDNAEVARQLKDTLERELFVVDVATGERQPRAVRPAPQVYLLVAKRPPHIIHIGGVFGGIVVTDGD